MRLCEDLLAWATLGKTPGLDALNLAPVLDRLGSAKGILAASDGERALAGVPFPARAYLRAAARPSAAEQKWIEHERHYLVPCTDRRYPEQLQGLADRPLLLYLSGNIEALGEPQLAVVGSRNPTPQGRETAHDLASRLAERGMAVTSGLAAGIDAAAHRGALAAQGITLAVFGSGLDVIYPRENASLSEDILLHGALVSEFPLGTAPRRCHFPQRNRIIAALSLGTLVVEAAGRSGSLITARSALDLGREVFAVPGSIHNPLSRGCHALIKQGAMLTETADDIFSELNFSAFFGRRFSAAADGSVRNCDITGMDKEHKILLDALGFDNADLDSLVVRTGFKAEAVSSMMLILELEGHVQAAPGGRYSRVANRRAGGER